MHQLAGELASLQALQALQADRCGNVTACKFDGVGECEDTIDQSCIAPEVTKKMTF